MFCYNPEICQPLSANVYGVPSADWAVCTLNLPSCECGKETCIDVKNSTIILISNLVLQINVQAVFHYDCA